MPLITRNALSPIINILTLCLVHHSCVWAAGISYQNPQSQKQTLHFRNPIHDRETQCPGHPTSAVATCQGNCLHIQWTRNGTFWKGISYSVFIFLFYSVCSKGRISSHRDHKHYFDWLTSLISKTWKTENVTQVAKKILPEFTDMIASGNNINATGVNI